MGDGHDDRVEGGEVVGVPRTLLRPRDVDVEAHARPLAHLSRRTGPGVEVAPVVPVRCMRTSQLARERDGGVIPLRPLGVSGSDCLWTDI